LKFIFIFVLSICSLFLGNSSAKAAEQINIIFEEMKIPINIDKLSKLEQYEDDSKEVIGWFKKNGFSRVFELTKFLKFPIFKQEGLNRQLLRSWVGRKILSELSKTIIVPNDKDGIEVFNTIENLLDDKKQISTLDIIQALPSEEILLDIENLILIISSWKKELVMQQNLILKLNELKLAKELSKRSTGRTMYILDEPTTGLHQHDIKKLLEILHTFVATGNTVVVIEHNLDVIKTADYVVDMGPDGGVKGGQVIAEGKPEDICNTEKSYTGKFLKPLLNGKFKKIA